MNCGDKINLTITHSLSLGDSSFQIMADLGKRHPAVRTGAKSRRTESKTGSKKKKMEMTLGSDFHLINFKSKPVDTEHPLYGRSYLCSMVDAKEFLPDDWKELNQLIIRYGSAMELIRTGLSLDKSEELHREYNDLVINDLQWSPQGSYILSLGADFAVLSSYRRQSFYAFLQRYPHREVQLADFSPGEKYLVTYNTIKQLPKQVIPSALQIFDVRTGLLMMGAYDVAVADISWPVIRWAGGKDDRYFASLAKNTISVYETATFNLLGQGDKPMEVGNVVDMCWSPTESIFALLKGCGKVPGAKVALVEIPGMVELKHKELPAVNAADCKMYWQSNGEYLAVKVDRSVVILSCIKERDIHIEVLQVDEKIHAFAWEPSGQRFAMIHGDQQSMPDVSFYSMHTPGKVSKLATLNDKKADTLFWSPRGKHIVLAGLKGSFDGELEFFDVDNRETMNKGEHPKATVVVWDPTGRYVATAYTITPEMEKGFKNGFDLGVLYENPTRPDPHCITRGRRKPYLANGFSLWSLKGKKLYWKPIVKEYRLLQLSWRPYGGGIIDDSMLKNLENRLEEYENGPDEETVKNNRLI